jgi:sugar lactone lactonase YvrE
MRNVKNQSRIYLLLAAVLFQLGCARHFQTYTCTTLAGSAGDSGSADGRGSEARFGGDSDSGGPNGVSVDGSGNVYVADSFNYTIRKVTPEGVVTTLAGMIPGIKGEGSNVDGIGSAARFFQPTGVAVDSSGNVFVVDSNNFTVRKITPEGVVTTLAGLAGSIGSADGTGTAARFNYAIGITVDHASNLFVADTMNCTIRKITPDGVVTTLAGLAASNGSADGIGSAARFYNPRGIAVDSAGNVYVADTSNGTIRKITPEGVVTTLAGDNEGPVGTADGLGSAAQFYQPWGIAVDRSGIIYVADTGHHTIRRITPEGMVTTVAGLARSIGSDDGMGDTARFQRPNGIAVDNFGNVYVADEANFTIRKLCPGM